MTAPFIAGKKLLQLKQVSCKYGLEMLPITGSHETLIHAVASPVELPLDVTAVLHNNAHGRQRCVPWPSAWPKSAILAVPCLSNRMLAWAKILHGATPWMLRFNAKCIAICALSRVLELPW